MAGKCLQTRLKAPRTIRREIEGRRALRNEIGDHAPEVADYLHARGHEVEVVTTADSQPASEEYPVRWIDRA